MIIQDGRVQENSLIFEICSVCLMRRPQSKIERAQKLLDRDRGDVLWCHTNDHSGSSVQLTLLYSIPSVQFGRGSTQPTEPHCVHLKCAQTSYQLQFGSLSSSTMA